MTIVESLTPTKLDNMSVPICVSLSMFLFIIYEFFNTSIFMVSPLVTIPVLIYLFNKVNIKTKFLAD